jgi:hypothetical protein
MRRLLMVTAVLMIGATVALAPARDFTGIWDAGGGDIDARGTGVLAERIVTRWPRRRPSTHCSRNA